MQRLKGYLREGIETAKNFRRKYRTDKFLKEYELNRFDNQLRKIDNFHQYKLIQISDHSMIFFLMSEQKLDDIDKLLKHNKGKLKEQILNDNDNQNRIFPFTFAVLNDLPEVTEYLKSQGEDLSKKHADGNTLVHIAAYFNKKTALTTCIKEGLNLNEQNDQGNTALHLAAIYGHQDIINVLLDEGANPLIENRDQYFPHHEAVLYDQLESFKLLEGSLNQVRNQQKLCDVIHLASMLETPYLLRHIIESNKALVNVRDNQRQQATPLHYAVSSRASDCAKLLLNSGSLLNIQDSLKLTPLHIAVESKNLSMCQLLVESNADATIKNADGLTPIDIAIAERDQSLVDYFRSVTRFSSIFK